MLLFVGAPRKAETFARLAALATQVADGQGDLIDVCLVDSEPARTPVPPGVPHVHDLEQALRRRYDGRPESLYLIRPDGYVGFRCEPAELGALRGYLDRLFLPGGPG